MRIGPIEITPLSDGEIRIPPTKLLSKSESEWRPTHDGGNRFGRLATVDGARTRRYAPSML